MSIIVDILNIIDCSIRLLIFPILGFLIYSKLKNKYFLLIFIGLLIRSAVILYDLIIYKLIISRETALNVLNNVIPIFYYIPYLLKLLSMIFITIGLAYFLFKEK